MLKAVSNLIPEEQLMAVLNDPRHLACHVNLSGLQTCYP